MGNRVFVIGASLSGIEALRQLLKDLPKDFRAPILITQHVASHSPGMLPEILTHAGHIPAVHPKSPTIIESGRIYVAPPDRHMLVREGYIRLSHGPQENLARPAIDPLFRSAAAAYGPRVVGIILTGQLDDGTAGLLAVKDRGGTTIVQDPSEATAASMPRSAIRSVPVDHCCKLAEMAKLMVRLADDDPPADAPQAEQKLLEVENRIAEGIFSIEDWRQIEQTSESSGLNCPNCRSALYEMADKRILRFRCRSGHAFSALSLLSGQADTREMLMSSTFGALIEEVTLARRMAGIKPFSEEVPISESLKARVSELEQEAAKVCDWLHSMTILVEPEPSC